MLAFYVLWLLPFWFLESWASSAMFHKLNDKKPRKGMFIQAYTSDSKIGAGIKSFMVLKVGRKYVELFYAPRLLSFKLTWREWESLAITDTPTDIMTDRAAFLKRLDATLHMYRRNRMRFREEVAKRAIELCGGKYVAPRKAKPTGE